ncbi:MAG: hypothetical protein M1831_005493 [Alyxoria varia]|nr:MAG: hypothetical protein M1831_005493 [Alyxoria varia]
MQRLNQPSNAFDGDDWIAELRERLLMEAFGAFNSQRVGARDAFNTAEDEENMQYGDDHYDEEAEVWARASYTDMSFMTRDEAVAVMKLQIELERQFKDTLADPAFRSFPGWSTWSDQSRDGNIGDARFIHNWLVKELGTAVELDMQADEDPEMPSRFRGGPAKEQPLKVVALNREMVHDFQERRPLASHGRPFL